MLKNIIFFSFFCANFVIHSNEDALSLIENAAYFQSLPNRKQEFVWEPRSADRGDVDLEVVDSVIQGKFSSTQGLSRFQVYSLENRLQEDKFADDQQILLAEYKKCHAEKISLLKKECENYASQTIEIHEGIESIKRQINSLLHRQKIGIVDLDFESKKSSLVAAGKKLKAELPIMKEQYTTACEKLSEYEEEFGE